MILKEATVLTQIFKTIYYFLVELMFDKKEEADITHVKFKPIRWFLFIILVFSLYGNFALTVELYEAGLALEHCMSKKP